MMHIAGEALALKRYSDKHGLEYGLRDCYELAPIIRHLGIDRLFGPELKDEWQKGFQEDRLSELRDEHAS